MSKRIAVIGASGFVGQAVTKAALRQGHSVERVTIRIHPDLRVASQPSEWLTHFSEAYGALYGAFSNVDAVVNAAGVANPRADKSISLRAANVVLPFLAAHAAHAHRVPRLVHVSSAAVQGRQNPLDEEPTWQPFSPYSQSKAEAEKLLLRTHERGPSAVVIYRATSVHGPDRPVTLRLAETARRGAVPVCRRGAVPLPVALWSNLGAGIVHAATTAKIEGIVLQPYEGMMAADLWKAFNPRVHMINVPIFAARATLAAIWGAGQKQPRLSAAARRLELLLLGQRIRAAKLAKSGFSPLAGMVKWRELGRMVAVPAGTGAE